MNVCDKGMYMFDKLSGLMISHANSGVGVPIVASVRYRAIEIQRSMGSWEFTAVAATRSRLEESLDYGRMTQGCRLLCMSSMLLPMPLITIFFGLT